MSQDIQPQAIDPVAEFLARGGKIQAVDSGVRAMNESEVYAKSSGNDDSAARFSKQHSDHTDRSMRDAENQVGLEHHHAYYRW